MVAKFTGRVLVVVVGLGGLAMAQDGLIVDPWHRVVSALGAAAPRPPAGDRTAPGRVGVASFPVNAVRPGPTVVPLGPPLSTGSLTAGVVPMGPAWTDAVVDPWSPVPTGRVAIAERPATRGAHSDWAREIDEIVDPWKRGPVAAFTDPIIVDPWAR